MSRPLYSRNDTDALASKSRDEILTLLGSFEDRGLTGPDFVRNMVNLIAPDRVPGLSDAVADGDFDTAAEAVLTTCTESSGSAPSVDQKTIDAADEVLANRFTFYDEPHRLPDDIDWDHNPGTAHWGHDLNRFSYLKPLTEASLGTGDEKYGRKAIDLILDWIAKCEIEKCFAGTPYVFGSYLNNTIHCSLWSWSVSQLIPTGIVKPIELLRILKSMQEQIAYLEVVTNGHAGNWPTIGCQGCLATMAGLPVLREQDRFASYFISTLANQVEEQILPDGVQDELTPHYHSVVVNNILTCAESCQKLGLSLEDRTLETLAKMVRYQEQTITPGRTAHVAFNDSDPDSVPHILHRLERLGLESLIPSPETMGAEAYPYAGVAFLRQPATEGDLYLAFDGGPFGRSHQHEDKLGFWLYAYGRDLIVDPGRHLYDRSEVSFLPYLVTTHAHSTITIDGLDQNSRAHRDTWIADSPGSLTFTESDDLIRASAQYDLGYGEENQVRVTHHREIVFVDHRYWVLFDSITGEGTHTVDSRLQFAPGDVATEGTTARTQFNDGNLLVITTGDWETRVLKGEASPRAGWYSASYNKIEPAPSLCMTSETELPLHYAVLLYPYKGTESPDASISFGDSVAVVTVDGEERTITSTGDNG